VRGTIGNIPNIGARRKFSAAEQHRACAVNNLTSLSPELMKVSLLRPSGYGGQAGVWFQVSVQPLTNEAIILIGKETSFVRSLYKKQISNIES